MRERESDRRQPFGIAEKGTADLKDGGLRLLGRLWKPIAEAPVSAFQDPQKRGAEPLGRPTETTALGPLGWKQTGVSSSRPEGQKGNSGEEMKMTIRLNLAYVGVGILLLTQGCATPPTVQGGSHGQ